MIVFTSTTAALLKMAYSSLLASIGVSIVFSLVIYGAIRSSDMRRANRTAASTAFATLAVCGFVAFVGAVVYGLFVVAQKG